MTDKGQPEKPPETEPVVGLDLMRRPFPAHQISKLPKESKAQTDARKGPNREGVNCTICGGWHHKNAVHLDYVGHAALTDRLLDADPQWTWEPAATTPEGLPAFDRNGGLWIRLTVAGMTRLGYGSADGKSGGDAVKEVIGDALRNAAMRFGAALDLWHKGDLHVSDGEPEEDTPKPGDISAGAKLAINQMESYQRDPAMFKEFWAKNRDGLKANLDQADYAAVVGAMKRIAASMAPPAPAPEPTKQANGHQAAVDILAGDEIPF